MLLINDMSKLVIAFLGNLRIYSLHLNEDSSLVLKEVGEREARGMKDLGRGIKKPEPEI